MAAIAHEKPELLARHYRYLCLSLVVGYIKHANMWMHSHKLQGKSCNGEA
jgi:hypothetical protein